MPSARRPLDLPLPDDARSATWCGACGESLLADGPAGGTDTNVNHDRCARRLTLEPPRYCGQCRRRMKVQVTPGTWLATCVEHGSVEHSTWS